MTDATGAYPTDGATVISHQLHKRVPALARLSAAPRAALDGEFGVAQQRISAVATT